MATTINHKYWKRRINKKERRWLMFGWIDDRLGDDDDRRNNIRWKKPNRIAKDIESVNCRFLLTSNDYKFNWMISFVDEKHEDGKPQNENNSAIGASVQFVARVLCSPGNQKTQSRQKEVFRWVPIMLAGRNFTLSIFYLACFFGPLTRSWHEIGSMRAFPEN